MRPAESAYDRMIYQSLERARDLLKKYKPGEVIPYEVLDEKVDDLGFNEVIEPATIEEPGEGFRVKDPRMIARIFQEPTGLYHWCDNDQAETSGMMDARGQGYKTKADAMRAAAFDGYTHATGSGCYWEGVRRIPANIREAI